ncbi:hypothetical protein ACQR2Y_12975 [Clostridium perfringens]
MESSFLISLGYSIGIVPEGKHAIGIIETGNDSLLLDIKSFSLWQLIFNISTKDEFISKYNKMYDDNEAEKHLISLINHKVVIEIINKPELDEYFDKLQNFKLFRQGFGIGINDKNLEGFIVVTDKEVILDFLEYSIWSASNNVLTIKDIFNKVKDRGIDKTIFILLVLNLFNKNLVYLMR